MATLIELAFYLSVLTYYVGTLVKALPLPFAGLKKWGTILMADGLFSASLVFSYKALLLLTSYVGALLGVSWERFASWYFLRITTTLSLVGVLKLIGIGLGEVGLGFLSNSLLSPFINALIDSMLALTVIYMVSKAMVVLGPTIMAIGLVLHAVPFRVTRSAGAMLVALPIIFTIGAPLMPTFVDTFASALSGAEAPTFNWKGIKVLVMDGLNRSVPYAVLEGYGATGEPILRYEADSEGVIDATAVSKGIPSSDFNASLNLSGYSYRFNFYQKCGNLTECIIELPDMYVIDVNRYVFTGGMQVEDVRVFNNDSIEMDVIATTSSTLIVVVGGNDGLAVSLNGNSVDVGKPVSYTWGGVAYNAYYIPISSGRSSIAINVTKGPTEVPRFDEIDYGKALVEEFVSNVGSLSSFIGMAILELLVFPAAYIALLVSASMGLAKLLGGSSSKIASMVVEVL
ncbi:MAG: hypothetical protein ABWK00_00075 [Desulfurococcaceae archaeon]